METKTCALCGMEVEEDEEYLWCGKTVCPNCREVEVE